MLSDPGDEKREAGISARRHALLQALAEGKARERAIGSLVVGGCVVLLIVGVLSIKFGAAVTGRALLAAAMATTLSLLYLVALAFIQRRTDSKQTHLERPITWDPLGFSARKLLIVSVALTASLLPLTLFVFKGRPPTARETPPTPPGPGSAPTKPASVSSLLDSPIEGWLALRKERKGQLLGAMGLAGNPDLMIDLIDSGVGSGYYQGTRIRALEGEVRCYVQFPEVSHPLFRGRIGWAWTTDDWLLWDGPTRDAWIEATQARSAVPHHVIRSLMDDRMSQLAQPALLREVSADVKQDYRDVLPR